MSKTGSDDHLGQSLVWLLALIALVTFLSVYLPGRRRTRCQEKELTRIRARIAKMQISNHRLENLCTALEAREPYTVTESIREVLHKGGKGEFVLEQ